RMTILCMLFFCSSVVLTVPSPQTLKYMQLLETIDRLKPTVKDKDAELLHTPENPVDECLFTAVACFRKGILKLEPKTSQVNATFTQTVRALKRFTVRNSGKQCNSTCESYEKKNPIEFLNSLENLIQKVI
ncbi:IL21 protein, partial [Bucco capensis]|nr:IL21 protein [Bucco capensis]